MPLPYENAQAGDRALGELQKVLRNFGCTRFGTMADDERGQMLVQFTYRGRDVTVRTSINGYAGAWLREHPWTTRMRRTKVEHERKAMQVASVAVCSLARDWIKGQITAVETGLQLTKAGHPSHPLYLRKTLRPRLWTR